MSLLDDLLGWGNNNIVKPAISTGQKAVNTVGAGVTGLVGLGQAGAQQLFGDSRGAQNTLNATQSAVDDVLSHGFGNQGAYLTPQQARGRDGIMQDFVKPLANATADIAPYVVPGGVAARTGVGLGTRVLVGAGVNGLVGGGTNALKQFANNGNVDLGQVGQATATGALIGGAFPLVGAGVKRGTQFVGDNLPLKPVLAAGKNAPLGLPEGYNMSKTGSVFGPDGKELTLGQVQQLHQNTTGAGYLTDFENAANQGNTKAMAAIQKAHPADTRLNIQSFKKAPPPTDAVVTPPVTALERPSRFANRTVQNSEEVSAPLKQLVKQQQVTYTPTTNQGRLDVAESWLKGKSNDRAYTDVTKSFENTKAITDQHVVNAIAAAKRLDASGKEGDLLKATEIYDTLSRHLSKKGQEVQAASLLSARTPQGLLYSATQTLRKAGVPPSTDTQKAIQGLVNAIKETAPGTEARDYAVQTLRTFVARQIPSSKLDKALGIWKAGLLTGVKTVTGNAESNATFRLGHEVSKPLAVVLDKGASLFTKKRSQAFTYRGAISGAGEGFQKGWKYFKTGIDERGGGMGNKFLENGGRETVFKNKALNAYVNGVFRNMGAQDRPFYYSQLRTSLAELATVAGKNNGLRGGTLREFVDKTMKEPGINMLQTAKNEADKAVLANDTALSRAVGGLRQGIDRMQPGVGRGVLKTAVETTMPFTGVPSAFVSRVLDFTPIGSFKLAANAIIGKKAINQRELTNAIAEATTGTAVMWLGAKLAENKQLSGPYPNDPKEQARWKAEGITPNSINIDGKWLSLNYLGPAGMLFNAGARAQQSGSEGGNFADQVGAAVSGAPKDLTQQSFLQGLSNAVSAVNDPGRYFDNYVNSQAGSVVPTIVNDAGNATDEYQRDRNNPLQAFESRVPGLRQTLPISNDVFGNQLKATSSPVDRMLNPLRPSEQRQSPVFDEMNRLHEQKVDVTPTPLDSTQTFDGVKVPLNDAQIKDLQIAVGQSVQKLWGEAIKTPDYQALSNDGKKKMLDNIYSTVLEAEKSKYAAANNLGQYAQDFTGKAAKLGADAKNYLNNNLEISKFAKEPGGNGGGSQIEINKSVGPTTRDTLKAYNSMDTAERNKYFNSANDAEYKYQQAKYENDVANGTLSKAQDARAKYDLNQAKVGSGFGKETRDLYGLNKTELYNILTSDQNGSQLGEQVVSYGDALEAAGLGNNKFRDSKGNISIAPKARTTSGSKRSSSLSSQISSVGSLSKKVASSKVAKTSFASKVGTGRGLRAYKKTAVTKVTVRSKA